MRIVIKTEIDTETVIEIIDTEKSDFIGTMVVSIR